MIKRTEEEIQALCDKARTLDGKFPGMTYEEGIQAALDWVLGQYGEDNEEPLQD